MEKYSMNEIDFNNLEVETYYLMIWKLNEEGKKQKQINKDLKRKSRRK